MFGTYNVIVIKIYAIVGVGGGDEVLIYRDIDYKYVQLYLQVFHIVTEYFIYFSGGFKKWFRNSLCQHVYPFHTGPPQLLNDYFVDDFRA